MKEGVHQQVWGNDDMSATVLSALYDMDMLYKDKSTNMNALHINSMLDRKAVGAPVASAGSGGPFTPGFFRRNSTSNVDSLNNGNKYTTGSSYGSLKENTPTATTTLMNKENKFRERAYSESGERAVLQQKAGSQINSTRYKTELCRPFEENGSCKYGEKCQFAHGYHELRSLSRHPKYKTEPCRTFHTIGFCPYGPRCHFIHNADERRPAPAANANVQASEARGYVPRDALPPQHQHQQQQQLGYTHTHRDRPKLHHSLSFSGFSSHHGLDSPLLESPTSRTPPPPASSCMSSSSFYDDVLSPNSVSCIQSAFNFPGQDLKTLLAPLAVHTSGGYSGGAHYGSVQGGMCPPSPPTYNMSHLQALRRLSESPVFEPPPSPPDSLSDRESYASGSPSSSGSLSGSESPSLDAGRRLPIFSRLSISDD
ncbi:mRNA decay activator protein ZFP36L2 isoform X2 [Syngnathoides biaculeatus]|uniref:mRNA decay activator protein ZFP36L2 isoform X2 n=1 Tax=Syngnathoides biaculeatus TaxID=300417 RepID=UPI002ADE5D8A|nr:mRNA decay activator protein ZFP36L2 isoform X2 [Syngnathoides biaculeatus]